MFARLIFAVGLICAALPAQAQVQNRPVVRLDVPYVPTPSFVVKAMLDLAKVTADDVVYDLGSGDGRIVIDAIQSRGVKRAVGIDLNPVRVADANANARDAGVTDRATFMVDDVFKVDFTPATVVTMYLLPNVNLRLRPRLLDELKPGTRVVSHAFHMYDWPPDAQEKVAGEVPIYLWIVPAKIQGIWSGKAGTQPFTLSVNQKFQSVSATLSLDAKRSTVLEGQLTGDAVTATGKDGAAFKGKLTGAVLTGTVTLGGVSHDVTLSRQ